MAPSTSPAPSLSRILSSDPARALIPALGDQNPWAQSRFPMDMISTAAQGAHSRRSSNGQRCPRSWTRFESQLSRRKCQTFSCGFNSGHLAGSRTTVMLAGTTSRSGKCHPAWSSNSTECRPGATRAEISASSWFIGAMLRFAIDRRIRTGVVQPPAASRTRSGA
jgi:hypothetical protein